jgi:hypothetical protein
MDLSSQLPRKPKQGDCSPSQPGHKFEISKKKKKKGLGGMAQVVQHLISKRKNLSSNLRAANKIKQ